MTRQEKSWILYDVANSSFALIIIGIFMPIFFKDVASSGVENSVSTANLGYGNSVASILIVFLAPLLGTFADYRGNKKRFLGFFLLIGVVFTCMLSTIEQGMWFLCLLFYILARIGFAGGNIFYDSLLTDITEKEKTDWVSSNGFAWGYLGSVIPLLLSIGVILYLQKRTGIEDIPLKAFQISFFIVGVWWLLFSIPLFRNVKQKHYILAEKNMSQSLLKGFRRLLVTFKHIKKYRQAFVFLLAYFFYIDGLGTIITMTVAYGKDVGLSNKTLVLCILLIQVLAFPCALLYGHLAKKILAKKLLIAGISVYIGVAFIGYLLPNFTSEDSRIALFWILAFLIATSIGGIQALSRSMYAKLIPPKQAAEFFGVYNMFGKMAVILGPLLMGIITRLTGHSRYGMLSILLNFIIGGAILLTVKSNDIKLDIKYRLY